jgi:serum/glucocorticoid-regulated kinase 2
MDLEEMSYLNDVTQETMKSNINLDSFLMLTVIGLGSYAKVILVKKKDNGKIYALKVLKKKKLKKPK